MGKPIITYAIENLMKSKIFDKIFVSTDSNEISKISKANGADVLIRSKKFSRDNIQQCQLSMMLSKNLMRKRFSQNLFVLSFQQQFF